MYESNEIPTAIGLRMFSSSDYTTSRPLWRLPDIWTFREPKTATLNRKYIWHNVHLSLYMRLQWNSNGYTHVLHDQTTAETARRVDFWGIRDGVR